MDQNKLVPTSEIGMEKGEQIYIEKTDSYYAAPTEITEITKTTIEFLAPVYQSGGAINFKTGENVKLSYWTKNGLKYSFSAIIQSSKSMAGTFTVGMPAKVYLDGGRRWTRYKPVNMLTSFMHKSFNNKINDTVYISRVANISAGGMLITTAKRLNIGDTVGVGFYAGDTFFTALCVVKSSTASKLNLGENDIALQFTNYTDKDKEYLESKLYAIHR